MRQVQEIPRSNFLTRIRSALRQAVDFLGSMFNREPEYIPVSYERPASCDQILSTLSFFEKRAVVEDTLVHADFNLAFSNQYQEYEKMPSEDEAKIKKYLEELSSFVRNKKFPLELNQTDEIEDIQTNLIVR